MTNASTRPTVGESIRRIRLEAGLTQEVLAAKIGIRQGDLSGLERGTRTPSLRMLRRIAVALETTVSKLTEGL